MNRDGAAVRTLLARGRRSPTRSARTARRRCTGSCASRIARRRACCSTRAPTRTSANAQGVAPLHVAIANRDLSTVELLLEAGADATLVDQAGETPLMLAARAGGAAIAARLLAAGAPVDAREADYDQTALMIAAREGHADVVRLLLGAGADVDAATRAGAVPAFRRPGRQRRARRALASSAAAGPSTACGRPCRVPRLRCSMRRGAAISPSRNCSWKPAPISSSPTPMASRRS